MKPIFGSKKDRTVEKVKNKMLHGTTDPCNNLVEDHNWRQWHDYSKADIERQGRTIGWIMIQERECARCQLKQYNKQRIDIFDD